MNDTMALEFRSTIKQARLKRGLSMSHMARKLGISTVYYSDVEAGKLQPFPVSGKVSYGTLASELDLDKGQLERLAGVTRDSGSLELMGLLRSALQELMHFRSGDDPIYVAYLSMQEKGVGAVPELCRLIRDKERKAFSR